MLFALCGALWAVDNSSDRCLAVALTFVDQGGSVATLFERFEITGGSSVKVFEDVDPSYFGIGSGCLFSFVCLGVATVRLQTGSSAHQIVLRGDSAVRTSSKASCNEESHTECKKGTALEHVILQSSEASVRYILCIFY
ncbi:MAG: hypothetical protein JWN12_189 [Candidatus Saccharibacteria bacterium]|nr:hypothetical protein [Candidatus Saccharibacteria bacterium]